MNQQIPYGFNPNNIQPIIPNNYGYIENTNYSMFESKIKELEQKIQAIENKLNITSSNNFDDTYKSSMYMM